MFRGDVVEACTSARAGTDGVAGGEGAFAAEGRGFPGCAGIRLSAHRYTRRHRNDRGRFAQRYGTLGNGAATVFPN